MSAQIIDFKTRRAAVIADDLQRIIFSGPEAAECQRIIDKHWPDLTVMDMVERDLGKEIRDEAEAIFNSFKPKES